MTIIVQSMGIPFGWVKLSSTYLSIGLRTRQAFSEFPSPNGLNHGCKAKFYSRSHDAVIRVYDSAGNVIETHEHAGEFKEW